MIGYYLFAPSPRCNCSSCQGAILRHQQIQQLIGTDRTGLYPLSQIDRWGVLSVCSSRELSFCQPNLKMKRIRVKIIQLLVDLLVDLYWSAIPKSAELNCNSGIKDKRIFLPTKSELSGLFISS